MSIKDIIGAVSAALLLAWGLYTELRMQKLLRADELLKRKLDDIQIVDAVHAESDSDLQLELKGDISRPPT
jgi:hypothetical protein